MIVDTASPFAKVIRIVLVEKNVLKVVVDPYVLQEINVPIDKSVIKIFAYQDASMMPIVVMTWYVLQDVVRKLAKLIPVAKMLHVLQWAIVLYASAQVDIPEIRQKSVKFMNVHIIKIVMPMRSAPKENAGMFA